jgi:hypothetical protein
VPGIPHFPGKILCAAQRPVQLLITPRSFDSQNMTNYDINLDQRSMFPVVLVGFRRNCNGDT